MMDNEMAASRLSTGMDVLMPDGRRGKVADRVYWSDDLKQWRCHVWPDQVRPQSAWHWIAHDVDITRDWVSLKCEDVTPI